MAKTVFQSVGDSGRHVMHQAIRFVPLMITCRELDDFLVDYFDGKLSPAQRLKFRLHLATCTPCRRYLRNYRRTMELGKAVFDDPVAPVSGDMPEDLVRAIIAARAES